MPMAFFWRYIMNQNYIVIKDAIASIKCFDDWHDRAFGISCAINEIGAIFELGDSYEESMRNERELCDLLRQKTKLYEYCEESCFSR